MNSKKTASVLAIGLSAFVSTASESFASQTFFDSTETSDLARTEDLLKVLEEKLNVGVQPANKFGAAVL